MGPEDWSWQFSILAHFYPSLSLDEIDEEQMNGYLQHVPALSRMLTNSLAALLTNLLKR